MTHPYTPYPPFLPLTPAQSWLLIIGLMAFAVLVAYLFYSFDLWLSLAAKNCKLIGIRGIWYAIRGRVCYEIRTERVVDVTKREDEGYDITTSDGESEFHYVVMATTVDGENPKYWDAIRIANGNQQLKDVLLPDSHVKRYFCLHDAASNFDTEVFIVYVKDDNAITIEKTMNAFFEAEHRAEVDEARRNKTLIVA